MKVLYITDFYYIEDYKDHRGIEILKKANISVHKINICINKICSL